MYKILLTLLITLLICSCSKTKEAKVNTLSIKSRNHHIVYMIITNNGNFEDINMDAFKYRGGQFKIGSCYIIKFKNNLENVFKKTPIILNAVKIKC